MADVFISYKHEDRETVARIADCIRAAGLSVWYDDGIEIGDNFLAMIRQELDASRAVLVIWSRSSVNSRWVNSEAMIAFDEDKLVSCRIEDCALHPPFNASLHVNLFEWAGDCADPAMARIIKRLKTTTPNDERVYSADIEARTADLLASYKRTEFPPGLEKVRMSELVRLIGKDYTDYMDLIRERERQFSIIQYIIATPGILILLGGGFVDYASLAEPIYVYGGAWILVILGIAIEGWLFARRQMLNLRIEAKRDFLERQYPSFFRFFRDEDDIVANYLDWN